MAGWRGSLLSGFTNRIAAALLLGPIGATIAALGVTHVSNLLWNVIDFPTAKTKTLDNQLLMVSSATHKIGKHGGDYYSVTIKPFGKDLSVTQGDYYFMLANRPGDAAYNLAYKPSDTIYSDGLFCAKVTVQQAGDALRVLNTGAPTLPDGSIILCPTDFVGRHAILSYKDNLSNQP